MFDVTLIMIAGQGQKELGLRSKASGYKSAIKLLRFGVMKPCNPLESP